MKLLDKLLEGRNERERRVLMAGVMVALPLFIWLLIWQPLLKAKADSQVRLAQKQEAYVWMQEAAAQLRAASAAGRPAVSGSPQEMITTAGRLQQLNINRIEPQSGGRFNVWVASADYDRAVRFIDSLLQSGLSVDSATISRLDGAPGTVSLRMAVGSGG